MSYVTIQADGGKSGAMHKAQLERAVAEVFFHKEQMVVAGERLRDEARRSRALMVWVCACV